MCTFYVCTQLIYTVHVYIPLYVISNFSLSLWFYIETDCYPGVIRTGNRASATFPDSSSFSSFKVEVCNDDHNIVEFCSTDLNNIDIARFACYRAGFEDSELLICNVIK